jgi:putative heme transporter
VALMRVRLRRRGGDREPARGDEDVVEIDAADLVDVFATPRWLRDVGLTAWLFVGVALFLVGTVWLLSLTETIVLPVIAAGVIAAVSAPLVGWLQRHRVPRPALSSWVCWLCT